MKGHIKHFKEDSNFLFIRAGQVEYFLHREDFIGDWNALFDVYNRNKTSKIKLEFEPTDSPKGMRASKAKLIDKGE